MTLVVTEPAQIRLIEIFTYQKTNGSLKSAKKVIAKIFDAFDIIKDFPYSGQEEEYLKKFNKGHRRYVKGYYKIIYRIENEVIYVTDIFDSRQDPSKVNP